MSLDGSDPPPSGPALPYALLEADLVRVKAVVESYTVPGVDFSPIDPWTGSVPPAPAEGYELHMAGTALVWVDVRSLATARTERLAAIQVDRDVAVFGTFTWDGSTFDADLIAQTRIHGMAFAGFLDAGFSQDYRLADGSWRTLSAADALALFGAMGAHLGAQFSRFASRQTAIEIAADNEDVDAVDW